MSEILPLIIHFSPSLSLFFCVKQHISPISDNCREKLATDDLCIGMKIYVRQCHEWNETFSIVLLFYFFLFSCSFKFINILWAIWCFHSLQQQASSRNKDKERRTRREKEKKHYMNVNLSSHITSSTATLLSLLGQWKGTKRRKERERKICNNESSYVFFYTEIQKEEDCGNYSWVLVETRKNLLVTKMFSLPFGKRLQLLCKVAVVYLFFCYSLTLASRLCFHSSWNYFLFFFI